MKKIFALFIVLLAATFMCGQQSGNFQFGNNPFPLPSSTIAPTSLSFGSIVQGAVSASQTVTFTATGSALVVSGPTLGTANFTITANTCGTQLPSGQACVVSVAFTPQSVGAASDTLTLITNSPTSPNTVALSGTGTSGSPTNPAVSLNKTSLSFPNITVGGSTVPLVVGLTNSGNATLNISSISFSVGTQYSKTTTCGATLGAGVTCTVSVTFTPTTAGLKTDTLIFTTNAASSPDNVSLSGTGVSAGSGIPLSPTFGFTANSTANGTVNPAASSVQFGIQRLHDSPPMNWPAINTALHTYNWTTLDTMLQTDFDNGILEVEFQIGRTPPWASSNQSVTGVCSYENGGPPGTTDSSGKGLGECFAPIDLNADGSGTDVIWTTWVTDLATHANDTNYLNGTGVWAAHGASCARSSPCKHAHIRYYEIANEPDTGLNQGNSFVHMSVAQLAREMEDAACAITGSQSGRRVIHKSQPAATATACAASPIDTTALMVMPPTHGKGLSVQYTQLMLYCNNVTGSFPAAPVSWQLPCPVVLNAMALQVDIIAEHFKPGAEGTTAHACGATGTVLCSIETGIPLYVANINAVLSGSSPNLTSLPMWDDEASYCPQGFTDSSCVSYADADMQRSFYPRLWLTNLSNNLAATIHYTWDSMQSSHGGLSAALPSYTQMETLIQGAVLTSPCTSVGQVWSCTLTKSSATYLVMWDASRSCSGGACTSNVQTVTGFGFFQDFTSASTRTPVPTNHQVSIGIKPVLFTN